MDQFARLLRNGFHQLGVIVTKAVHCDAGKAVEVLFAFSGPHPRAIAVGKRNGLSGIGFHQVVCHGKTLYQQCSGKTRGSKDKRSQSVDVRLRCAKRNCTMNQGLRASLGGAPGF
jgi:hypothetical protein